MLKNVDAVQWDRLTHAYGKASDVPGMLHSIDSATDNDDFLKQYHRLMESVNHQGDIYDSTVHVVPFVIQMLRQSTDPFRIIHHLIILADLLRHTSRQHYQQSSFPKSIVPYRQPLHVYDAVRADIDLYLRLMLHEDEPVRAGSIYILSFLVDEYARILPALNHCTDQSKNDWLRAGAIWAYSTVACYEMSATWNEDAVASVGSEHLRVLETWSQNVQQIVRFAAALGYIAVLASDRSRHGVSTPEHIVDLVVQALSTDVLDEFGPYNKATGHIGYVYSEISPFNNAQEHVIRWCKQAADPMRWAVMMARLTLTPMTAHELVREMLDSNFARVGSAQHSLKWNNHPVLNPSEINNGVIYAYKASNRHYTDAESLNDNQHLVLRIICDCEPFWELPTNLFSFYYGLPDEREALCELSDKE